MVKGAVRLLDSCLARLSLALKWFCPGRRASNLPVGVTRNLLLNDLLVFIRFRFLRFFNNG